MRLDVATTVLIFVLCLSLMIYHFIRSQYFISSRNVLYFYLRAREMVENNDFDEKIYVEILYIHSFNKTTSYQIKKIGNTSPNYLNSIELYRIFENGTIVIYKIYFKN